MVQREREAGSKGWAVSRSLELNFTGEALTPPVSLLSVAMTEYCKLGGL